MTLLDNGWTDEQTQGLLHSLNLDGGTLQTHGKREVPASRVHMCAVAMGQ